MKALSIRAYLTRLIWLCVLPLVLLTFYLAFHHVESLQSQLNREAADRAHDVSTAIDSRIEAQIAGLQLLAASSLADDTSQMKEFYREAQGFRESFGGHVILADPSLQMRFNTRVPFGTTLPKLPQPRGHAAAPAVLATAKPAVGDMFPGPIAKETLVAVVVPVIRGGGTQFLLLSTIETAQFQRLVDNLTLPRGWSLTLLDGKSEMMAHRAFRGSAAGPGGEERPLRFVAKSRVSPWSVVLEIPRSVYRAPIVRTAAALAVAILAITFISVLAASQAGRRLTQAVATLTAARSPGNQRPVIAEVEEIRGVLAEAAAAREAADSARRESEERYRNLLEVAPVGIAVHSEGKVVFTNPAGARLLGAETEEQIVGKPVTEIVHPDGWPEAQARIRRMLAGERGLYPAEDVYRRLDGTSVNVEVMATLLTYQGRPAVQVIVTDITERKRAERALRDAHARLRSFVDANIVGVVIASPSGGVIEANDYYLRTIGYSREEYEQGLVDWRAITPPEWLPADNHAIEELRERGTCTPYEKEYLRRDGTRVAVFLSDAMLPGPEEQIAAFVLDITERKRAEAELLRSEAEFRRLSQEFNGLLDAIPDSLTLVDADLKILWANRAAVETIGLTAAAVTGRHCYALWHNRSSACDPCPVARSFTTGQSQSETVTKPDGRIWDIRTVPLVDAQGRVTRVIEVKRDITEHRRLEDQLRQAQKLEGIGQLAGGIAHDFNNVLGAVLGFAGVLQMSLPEGDPLRHYTDELVAAGERGASLTRQILAFSRKQVFDLKPVRLNGIVRGLEKMLRRLLPESIDIAQDLHEEDPVALVDTSQIEQVLINLATNARDAIAGIGRIEITTGRFTMDRDFVEAHGYGEPGEYAVLAVTDTGRGMDAATRARIFEPFFTTKEIGKGTGLGLAVVYGIIKQHRGFINVYSEVGKGTVIRVYLPLASGSSPVMTAATPPAPIAGGNETILVAEDDEILRRLSRTVLGRHGYTVIEAEDGEDAVAKFAENQETIRLVILDGLMPKKGGVEALEEIRRLCPVIKAVFMSGYADDIFSGGGLRDKAAAFIQKPVMPAELLRLVREVLDR